MRALFMGKCKRSAARALDGLVAEGWDVAAVVAAAPDEWTTPEQRLDLVAERHEIALVDDADLYAMAEHGELGDVDLVISFLFWKRIREPLISLGRVGCLNFHPAPLPDFRGVGGYNVAILEGLERWGVSCHFVDERFDAGDLVEVERFAIDPACETALSLDVASQERLLQMFRRVTHRVRSGEPLPRTPQGDGRYVTREELEALRTIRAGDDVERKVRAFWYPPWPGAVVDVEGRTLTLVDQALLEQLAGVYRAAGTVP